MITVNLIAVDPQQSRRRDRCAVMQRSMNMIAVFHAYHESDRLSREFGRLSHTYHSGSFDFVAQGEMRI